MTRKTSISFKQSIYSRKNSGGPGYLLESKILAGKNTTENGQTYINSLSEGFKLKGADNSGNCYNIRTSLSNG